MAEPEIVKDAFLRTVQDNAAVTRDQCMALLGHGQDSQTAEEQTSTLQIQERFRNQHKTLNSSLAQLRGYHRDAIFRVRQTKHTTAEARQEIDRLHLQLQNLYYEQRHLKGEIAACEAYDHKYQQLPLIPVEQFLAEFPEHQDADENELMIARINHEHAGRESLEQARLGLLKKKQSLISENMKRRDDLANLDKNLETFIDAAKPIQETFGKEY